MKSIVLPCALYAALAAAPAAAQQQPAPSASEQMRARYQMRVMERVLAEAVQLGARLTGVQMPSLVLVASPARARGFWLDNYGLFFDVEVPPLKGSMAWSIRTLGDYDAEVRRALQSLRRQIQALGDPSARTNLEQAVQRLERQVGPTDERPAMAASMPPVAPPAAPGQVQAQNQLEPPDMPEAPPAPREAASREPADDPGAAYTAAVKSALIEAMLDYGSAIPIGETEWLTVAAREAESFAAGGMYDSVTLTLRVRGSDLLALRAGRATREEARARVEAREF
jgi:hypothetical protein